MLIRSHNNTVETASILNFINSCTTMKDMTSHNFGQRGLATEDSVL